MLMHTSPSRATRARDVPFDRFAIEPCGTNREERLAGASPLPASVERSLQLNSRC